MQRGAGAVVIQRLQIGARMMQRQQHGVESVALAAQRTPAPYARFLVGGCQAGGDEVLPGRGMLRHEVGVVEEWRRAHEVEEPEDAAHGAVELVHRPGDVFAVVVVGVQIAQIKRPAVHAIHASQQVVGHHNIDMGITGLAPERELLHHIAPARWQTLSIDLDAGRFCRPFKEPVEKV